MVPSGSDIEPGLLKQNRHNPHILKSSCLKNNIDTFSYLECEKHGYTKLCTYLKFSELLIQIQDNGFEYYEWYQVTLTLSLVYCSRLKVRATSH